MKIENLNINNIGGIISLSLDFDPQMNIICGPNGVGKSTILDGIGDCFSQGNATTVKRNINSENGSLTLKVEIDGTIATHQAQVSVYEPMEQSRIFGLHSHARKVLSLKTQRTFPYQSLQAISRDPDKKDFHYATEASTGLSFTDIKNWFCNRFLYSGQPGSLNDAQLANLALAKECFSVLNPGFKFRTVQAATNDIVISTPTGVIYYEYLSSGFKSCLSVLLGIIKEIEYRFRNSNMKVVDFDGVILIDEIDMHLHPEWQATIVSALMEIFPAAQFICTTHSPHVIQAAKPNHVVALESIDGQTGRRALPSSSYGFQGWTIEEVLEDVMGMIDTRTKVFRETINRFGAAIDIEDSQTALCLYRELNELLHPNSHVRKLLRLQLASIEGGAQ